MTGIHPILKNSQDWTFALRQAMGYPTHALPFHPIGWCSSGRRDIFRALQMTELATDMGRDLVVVEIAEDGSEAIGVSLAIREGAGIQWISGLKPYCASETARIELLAPDRRWAVGPRQILTSAKLPPKARRSTGETIAWRRWRQTVAKLDGLKLEGNLFVPEGGRLRDAIPHENIRVAA